MRSFQHVADHVESEPVLSQVTVFRDTDADGRVPDCRAINRHRGICGGRDDSIFFGAFRQVLSQQVQELTRGVRAGLVQSGGKRTDHFVGLTKFLLIGQRVVHAVDQVFLQQHVVDFRGALEVLAPQGLMNIMKQVGSGRHQAVDQAVLDHVDDQAAHASRHHRARHAQHDHHTVAEHLLPDPVSYCERPSLKGNSLHFLQQVGHIFLAIN